MTYTIGSLCTGYGGLDMATQAVFGGRLAWWSDIEPGPIKVMASHHPDVPNVGDIKTADWSQVPPVDILTAGYPCQPFSNAGKRLGTDDPRHLWPHIEQAVSVLRPRVIVLENVAAHLRRGFDRVCADLAELGYDTTWTLIRASDIGAAHQRRRLFALAVAADTPGPRRGPAGSIQPGPPPRPGTAGQPPGRGEHGGQAPAHPEGHRRGERRPESTGLVRGSDAADSSQSVDWREYEPAIRRWERHLGRPAPFPAAIGPRGGTKVSPRFGEWLMGLPEGHVSGVPGLTINQQLRLIGNGVMPQQAECAIRHLWPRLMEASWLGEFS